MIFKLFKKERVTREEAAEQIKKILAPFPPMNQREVLNRVLPEKLHIHANPPKKHGA